MSTLNATINKLIAAIVALSALALLASCDKIDNKRIPPAQVYIAFPFEHDWTLYGTPGATSYKYFIKAERIPSDYPWTALTETGFGGVLLCSDINGYPVAYDMACPVECKPNVRIAVEEDMRAHCHKCGSVYEVFTNEGYPVGGPAAEKGYGLQRYYCGPSQNVYMLISR